MEVKVGEALIKPQFLAPSSQSQQADDHQEKAQVDSPDGNVRGTQEESLLEPVIKRPREDTLDNNDLEGDDGEGEETTEKHEDSPKLSKRARKKEKRGQNKNRPRPQKFARELKLCPHLHDGPSEELCPRLPGCHFLHDINQYLEFKENSNIPKPCYMFTTYGKCPRGLTCVFSESHIDPEKKNVVKQDLWEKMRPIYESTHNTILDKDTQFQLRHHKYDFKGVEEICRKEQVKVKDKEAPNSSGPFTDEDKVIRREREMKQVDWKDKLYLSPLTTVGNLPFRRICVDFGADITCSEMSLATSILQGNAHEFALHRRHPSEKIWGVQLCASSSYLAAKAAHVLAEVGVEYDFVDLNVGCPLEPIFRQGAGSGLMCRENIFGSIVKSMSNLLETKSKIFTVKMRAGVKTDKYIAHNLIPICRDAGVSLVTLHGRTKEQRYTKSADWNYISSCVGVASPMSLFGNGDILSWQEYEEKRKLGNFTGVMIGRGALMKPWIFQEIKEQRDIDMSSSQRMEIIQRYANYGLDHWGSDAQGVETTRRFLLEWLSFFHRYIPFGILERTPQRINERPPKYFGRDEMETLLSSTNAADWVKISEMVLGQVPQGFNFVPKHKANSWG